MVDWIILSTTNAKLYNANVLKKRLSKEVNSTMGKEYNT